MSQVELTFQEIHEAYRGKIHRYLNRLTGASEAEDLTQEVFVKVSRSLQTFRGESTLTTWIYRIATNAAMDRLLEYPRFSLVIENKVTAHSIPAGGPVRVLVLEVALLDASNRVLYEARRSFAKRFDLMPVVGLMPYKIIENTQLRSGELRTVDFTVPATLQNKIAKAHVSLRMCEISDEHQGNPDKAHWMGAAILNEEVQF